MGAWGARAFENDDALDWVAEFEGAPSELKLRRTFDAVLGSDDYLDVDIGGHVVAAAEVVAAAAGGPAQDLPPLLRDWAAANAGVATRELVARALAAIERVRNEDNSEIAQLWAEGPPENEWLPQVDDLRRRLGETKFAPD
jgi:hypothetical protein